MTEPHVDAPITLDQLRVFAAVVEHRTFSDAARALRRSQSTVSYTIGSLEGLLDVSLFDRAARPPALTEEGQVLLTEAQAVIERADQLVARAHLLAAARRASMKRR